MLSLVLAAALQWPLSTPQSVPAPATPRAAVEVFVDAFIRDDLGEVHGIFASQNSDPGQTIEFLDRYRCITIQHPSVELHDETPNRASATVRFAASGMTLSKQPIVEALPEVWDLSLIREEEAWRIETAAPRERAIAGNFIWAPNDEERRCILELASDADAHRILDYVTYDGSDFADRPGVLQAIELAQTMAHEQKDIPLESAALRRRAFIAFQSGDAATSLALTAEAARLAKESGDPDTMGHAHFSTGIAHWFNGNLSAAVASLDAAGALLEESTDPRPAIKAIYMAGVILDRFSNLRSAIAYKTRSLRSAEAYDWREGVSASSIGLAEPWRFLGHYDLARAYATRAYRTALSIGQYDHAKYALWTLASTMWSTGEQREATKLMRFVLEHDPPEGARQQMRALMAAALIELNEIDEAESVLDQAIPAESGSSFALLHARSSLALARHRYEETIALVDEAHAVALQPSTSSPDFTTTTLNKGRALLALGRTDEAFEVFRDAVAWIEDVREELPTDALARTSYFIERLQPYEALVALSIARGDTRQALAFAEQKRGRVLADVMRRGFVEDSASLTAEQQAKEDELAQQLTEANRALLASRDAGQRKTLEEKRLAARIALLTHRAQVEGTNPNRRTRRAANQDVLDQPRQLLRDERAAIVLYDVQPEQTFAFVITRKGDRLDLATTKIARTLPSLRTASTQLARAIRRRDLGWSRDSRALYDLVVRPLEKQLAGRTDIIIIPDGPLWDVPFHALQQSSGELLLERATLSYAPSLAAITREHDHEANADSLLAIGDPAIAPRALEALGGHAAFARLPEAAAEVADIAAFYPADAFETLTGKRATESAFKEKAERYRVLHVAAHGILDGSPMHSALLLAGSEQDDGLLEAREIVGLPLNAELTVLSACDTASGNFTPGEGVMGLSWAFMIAGCPTTIASHWQVGSSATRQLMSRFYRALRKDQLSPAAALRRAQLSMMSQAETRHPLYWAAFVSIGAP